jgi:uncharacterized protein
MTTPQDLNDAEIGELDDLLAAIPQPLDALDVVMLDGYLCGVLSQPVAIDIADWLPPACDWNLGEGGQVLTPDTPGWHSAKHERLMALVQRRYDAIHRAMVEDEWFDPVVMQPLDDDDQPLTGRAEIEGALAPWVTGYEHALNHFPALEELGHADLSDLLACLRRHLPEQSEEEQAYTKALDEEQPLKSLDAAIEDLVATVIDLATIGRTQRLKVPTVRRGMPKVGRNEPCPCGSGRKFKLCHGRDQT